MLLVFPMAASQQLADLYVNCTYARVPREGETAEQAAADIAARKAKADAVLKLLAETGQLEPNTFAFKVNTWNLN